MIRSRSIKFGREHNLKKYNTMIQKAYFILILSILGISTYGQQITEGYNGFMYDGNLYSDQSLEPILSQNRTSMIYYQQWKDSSNPTRFLTGLGLTVAGGFMTSNTEDDIITILSGAWLFGPMVSLSGVIVAATGIPKLFRKRRYLYQAVHEYNYSKGYGFGMQKQPEYIELECGFTDHGVGLRMTF